MTRTSPPKGLVIAGAASGSGKTTATLALMAAFKRRGLAVQGFKVGPDFIDPGHHARAVGRPSHNLDGWMLSRAENLDIFHRRGRGADVVLVEGVMGLYDGADGLSEAGSTAQMAKWLGLPVLLCVDARAAARSLAAVALGFRRFDPAVDFIGLAANRVGSEKHRLYLAEAMTAVPDMAYWGGLIRNEDIALAERHLGLITADEAGMTDEALFRLADWVESGLDVDGLWAALPTVEAPAAAVEQPPARGGEPVRIGLARDAAFCFYYEENLRRLAAAGAELVPFSPLADPDLPKNLKGLYIGGGYPELFAETLAENRGLTAQIRAMGRAGAPIYGECGGLMYLGRSIKDLEGRRWEMTGLLPLDTAMLPRLKALGYREVRLTGDALLGPAGARIRGHEFHYSEITASDSMKRVYEATDRAGNVEAVQGYMQDNILAGYVHLHFGSRPEAAERFVDACRKGPLP